MAAGGTGVLYVVATPIGNLADLSQRAVQVLSEVDLIAAEDTRRTRQLLTHYGIHTRLWSSHEHNETERVPRLIERLEAGEDLALVSDAGTPLISDPGYPLVRAARARGLRVVPIPGANAAICALSAAGLPSDRFLFLGFPPRVAARRREWMAGVAGEPGTLILYEAANRAEATLRELGEALGPGRRAVVARELTKRFETFLDGTLAALAGRIAADPEQQMGELVILVEGAGGRDNESPRYAEEERVLRILLAELPLRQAAALAARITGGQKNRLYQTALEWRTAGLGGG
jgi:16S rRNA (cytidine1402-2'-O)-methyltransferase